MSQHTAPWDKVTLFGVEHSPWVLGVRLALGHHKIPSTLTSIPMDLSWLLSMGPVFPVLETSDGVRHVDSFAIYDLLERSGFPLGIERFGPDERLHHQTELEELFRAYASGRCVSGKRWNFIKAWSTMRELPFNPAGLAWRSWLTHYFWILIQVGNHLERRKQKAPYDLQRIDQLLTVWEERLGNVTWLTGSEPGFLDYALMGHIQCMTSGLTDELLPHLRNKPQLLRWVRSLTETQLDHTPNYARRLWDKEFVPAQADASARWGFWIFWVLSLLFWPISLGLIGISLKQRTENPAHTGAVSRRYRQAERRKRSDAVQKEESPKPLQHV